MVLVSFPYNSISPSIKSICIFSILLIIVFEFVGDCSGAKKVRHRGKYSVREEVIKKKEKPHPCQLTRTSVKVTFPGMKSEVLVSFLGYKEPNLIHVMRCKGICSEDAVSPVACVPTKRRLKKIKMHFKSQMLGSEDVKEKFRELVFEEHEECACQCLTISASHCVDPRLFNNDTCSCMCDNTLYQRGQQQCESYSDRSWDPATCSCRRKNEMTIPGHVQLPPGAGLGNVSPSLGSGSPAVIGGILPLDCRQGVGIEAMSKTTSDYITDNSYTLVGICSFFIGLFLSTTIYYWRKSRQMAKTISEGDACSNQNSSADDCDHRNGVSFGADSSADNSRNRGAEITEHELEQFQRDQVLSQFQLQLQMQNSLSQAPIDSQEPTKLVCNSEGVMVPQTIDLDDSVEALGGSMGLPNLMYLNEAELFQQNFVKISDHKLTQSANGSPC